MCVGRGFPGKEGHRMKNKLSLRETLQGAGYKADPQDAATLAKTYATEISGLFTGEAYTSEHRVRVTFETGKAILDMSSGRGWWEIKAMKSEARLLGHLRETLEHLGYEL